MTSDKTEIPLTRKEVELIASVYRALKEELPGFVGRQQQKDMIQTCARAFALERCAVIEAPTGTGKSFGYQIPGIVLALSRDKRVIISTETANLQDQIAGKDLRLLARVLERLDMESPAVVVKGRERYVCPVRLDDIASQTSLLENDDATNMIKDIDRAWENGWNGQRDTLPFKVSQPIWIRVNNNRHICTNDRCPAAKECPHMQIKSATKSARIIVTNHSFLLSTIAANAGVEGKKNPVIDFEKNYYVFDEAHHLNSRIIESFSSKAVIDEDLVSDALRMLGMVGSPQQGLAKIRFDAMRGIGLALRLNLKSMVGQTSLYRFTLGKVPAVLAELIDEYRSSLDTIIDIIDSEFDVDDVPDMLRNSESHLWSNLRTLAAQMTERSDSLSDFTSESESARARWIDFQKDIFTVHTAPYEAAALARTMLWKNMRGAVLTSATIALLGQFDRTLASLGLPDTTLTMRLSSPLDFTRARLLVPRQFVDATSPGHGSMVTAILRAKFFKSDEIGGLVYFTSRKKMEAVYAKLSAQEQGLVIMQGSLSPSAMIDEHKRRIDVGSRSILFGLDSIAEGVDLPGKYCTQVFVDKLPFPSPDDPILASHSEYLESKGLHPFPLIMLPEAAKKFAQVAGRLIRTEVDWGDLYVLDRRLVQKKYGLQLLNSTSFSSILQV